MSTSPSPTTCPPTRSAKSRTLVALPEHIPLIKVPDAPAFVAIVRHLRGWVEAPPHGIDLLASVDPAARIGPDASIFPFVVIGAVVRP